MTAQTLPLSTLILAGGQGRRMDGRDKGLITFDQHPFVEHSLRVARPYSDDLIISCNRNLEHYRAYAKLLVQDQQQDYRGPLAGILAGLNSAIHPAMLVLPCDTPMLPPDLPARLYQAYLQHPNAITLVDDGQRLQPLHAIYPLALKDSLQAYLDGGRRAVMGWLDQQSLNPVDFSAQAAAFTNVNRPEELRSLEQAAQRGRLKPDDRRE